MSTPLVQVVDTQDRPIGAATKKEIWEKGLWHRIVRIVVEDAKGRILLQKRSANKQPYPNRWDNSAAGHVDEGEIYDEAAPRELKEELGLQGYKLEVLGSYQVEKSWEWRKLNRFIKVYRVRVPVGVKLTTEGPDEIAEVKWFTNDEAQTLIAEHPNEVTDGLQDVFRLYYS